MTPPPSISGSKAFTPPKVCFNSDRLTFMKLSFSCRRVGLVLLGLFVLIATGCSTTGVKTVRVGPVAGIKSILVLPFLDDLAKIYGEAGLIKCPLSDYIRAGPVPPHAGDRLSAAIGWHTRAGVLSAALITDGGCLIRARPLPARACSRSEDWWPRRGGPLRRMPF